MIAPTDNRILWLPGESRMWDDEPSSRSNAGVRIDETNAHQVAAVFACLRVIAETVAGLPLHVLERTAGGGKRIARELPLYRQLHSQPNGWQTSFEWREQSVFHVGLWGDAFDELKAGQIVPLHPSRMKVERIENGKLRYKYREDKGTETVYADDAILQIRGPSDDGVNGMSVVAECKDAIALARACELHGARFFAAGARPGFVLSTDGQLNAEAREALRSQWDRRHGGVGNSHNTAVLTGGLKPYDIPQSSNSDSQFIELRRYQLEEIARLFRVPGSLLGIAPSTPDGDIAFVTHCIMPWLRRFESAFMRDLIADDDRYLVEFDVRGLLRGDAASRSAYYRAMWDIGVVSTNDIRATENLDPVEGGDVRYRPLNMGTLGEQPSEGDVLAQQQPGSEIDGQAVEGGLAAAAGEPVVPATPGEPVEPEAPQVADVSLNGAQITGLIAIIQSVVDGLVSKDGAAAMVSASFPSMSTSQIEAILAGVVERQPAPAAVDAQPPPAEPMPTAPAGRSMTISVDFDRTFSADPQLWGEFARKAVADGNRVVMISRRPEADRGEVIASLGDFAESFSDVLLVGNDTLKDDAAQAAGIAVDVWVDDSPQFIRGEQRSQPGTVSEGDFVSWGSSGGRARGRVDHVMDYGTLDVPGTDFKIEASEEDPAALITVYEEVTGGWRATETQVGHKVATLTKIDPLPEPPPAEENSYGKPKRKGRKRG
jgi:HK97 family phage portal protein